MSFTGIRLRPDTKTRLEELAGEDFSMDKVVRILLDNFIEPDDDDDDEGQASIFDYDEKLK
jgi:hypothetical protein